MRRTLAAALLLSLGTGLGLTLAALAPPPSASPEIEWLERARPIRPFALQSDTGRFDRQALLGRQTLVLFGFLNCPDICPTSLAELAALAQRRPGPAYVFISVDPQRDSVTEVGAYARYFNYEIRGVTGSKAQLEQLARDLGVQFTQPGKDHDGAIAHSVTLSVIDANGALSGRIRPGFDVAQVARELATTR